MHWTIDIWNEENKFLGTKRVDSVELLKLVNDVEGLI